MPPSNIRCNIISHDGMKKLTKEEFQPYLPATFNVPVKEVYAILGMSRHSLAPMRAKWGTRWPYADVCRGQFGPMTWKDIEDFRTSAIENEHTDSRIVTILKTMAAQSAKHKHKLDKRIAYQQRQVAAVLGFMTAEAEGEPLPPPPSPATLAPTPTSFGSEHVTMGLLDLDPPGGLFPDDEAYWTGLSELLLIHLNAPPGELFPPVEL